MAVDAEALICSAQEQALRTNYIKFHIDKNVESPMCGMCGEKGESVNHLTSECSKLAQREYKRRHDNVALYVHWQLCGKAELEQTDKWYKHTPERVLRPVYTVRLVGPIFGGGFEKNRADLKICCTATEFLCRPDFNRSRRQKSGRQVAPCKPAFRKRRFQSSVGFQCTV